MDWLIRALWNLRWRGKVRLLAPLVPQAGSREAWVFGTRINLDLSDYVQRMMYLGCFEREETGRVLRHLRPGMTFVDVGANAGYFIPGCRVWATGSSHCGRTDPSCSTNWERYMTTDSLCHAAERRPGSRSATSLFVPPVTHANAPRP